MVFTPRTWADNELYTAAGVNRLEQGVADVDAALNGKVDTTDPRLTDARTPTAHKHPVSDVTGLAGRIAALEYDSGPRNITSLAGSNIADGSLFIRRVGNTVTLYFNRVKPSTTYASGATMFTLPAGFRRPGPQWWGWLNPGSSGSVNRSCFMFSDGRFGAYATTVDDQYRMDLTYVTSDAVPASPPGTPA